MTNNYSPIAEISVCKKISVTFTNPFLYVLVIRLSRVQFATAIFLDEFVKSSMIIDRIGQNEVLFPINITLSQNLRKDKKLVHSENFPF